MDNWKESLKELNDLEFEILMFDNIYKKLKPVNHIELTTPQLLLTCLSISDHISKYKSLADESGRTIPHSDVVNMIVNKCDNFLKSVANNEEQSVYAYKEVESVCNIIKEFLLSLKAELVELPKYAHLKVN